VHRRLPVLKAIAWSPDVREHFFDQGERELPVPRYRGYDASADIAQIQQARKLLGHGEILDGWLTRAADSLETTARMLAAVGTAAFSEEAQRLYGHPSHFFPGTERTPLEFARRLIRTARRVSGRLPDPPPPNLRAGEVAEEVRLAVNAHFGKDAPKVEVVSALTARASAAPKRIRLRRNARFSDLDVRQLVQHEAFVHVATALNGRRQRRLPILAANHAGTTRTQEGLAVFAELMSGALDPQRFLRLAHRVVAIDMALQGADFLEVYRYYLDHSPNRVEAFESTARVFRGGVLTGGAPFTKDMVYLDGLCRVHVFIRAVIDTGRVDCLRLLFAGKLDLVDIPAVIELRRLGLCHDAKFVPPWVSDPRRLLAYFAVTDIIGRASTAGLRRHYVAELKATRAPDDSSSS
jgi:uncharacterized protein (TIGR02421 family)